MSAAMRTVRLGLLLLAALFVAGMPVAQADSPSFGGDVSVAQTLGDRELTVILRRITSIPGPLRVDIVTHAGTPPGRLRVAAVPFGSARDRPAPGAPTSRGEVELGAAAGMYSTDLEVDRAGPWELTVDDGMRVARIPFAVPAQVVSPPERLVYGGFLIAGVLLPISVLVAVRARRTAWALVPACGMIAGVAVAVTAALLSATLPLPPQPGAQLDPSAANLTDPYYLGQPQISDYSRPPVMLTVADGALVAGRPGELRLAVTDSATGATADDLVVHDSALMHLLVIGPGGDLHHLHPIRTGPGRYEAHLTPSTPGRYALSAEVARRGGGVQMVWAATGFAVGPGAAARPVDPVRLGANQSVSTVVGETPVTVTMTPARAGTPTTLSARFGDRSDLQPWLGMVGHMIVAGPIADEADIAAGVHNSPVWGHAHSMGGTAAGHDMTAMHDMPGHAGSRSVMLMLPANGDSAPDETVAAYGPEVPFTYTFPAPGRYRIWIQAERGYTVHTVAVALDVAP
ncbi:hypothetical protein NDR87_20140 [Nocardia sp. CDC159]|uniref:Secreted protein n=1 Tax=Nocardia pulmonis TaxID=2951408 RepID=A0A9X2ED09_9NOCA|nr:MULTISPECIES: hypothetical protein [Nocardia]MCM6775993.1 hypothetical protein [Nocardia pulmonis]MCM6788680.1 hypothetical protein [Nocardia sp. CDC159]